MVLAALAVAVFFAAAVRGATGFGFSLIAALVLSTHYSAASASSIVLMLDLAATGLMMRGGALAGLDRREALHVGVFALIGALAGVLLLKVLPERPALIGLNLAVLVSALAALAKVRSRFLEGPTAAVIAAFLTGAMIGAFSVGGTLIVAWLVASGRSPARSIALLTVVFACTDTATLAFRMALGVLPAESVLPTLMLLPIVALGIYAGRHLFGWLSPAGWKRLVACILVALALGSLARTLSLA